MESPPLLFMNFPLMSTPVKAPLKQNAPPRFFAVLFINVASITEELNALLALITPPDLRHYSYIHHIP